MEVYNDPKYDTVSIHACRFERDILTIDRKMQLVFRTVGGQSKCPHENGTLPIELPYLSLEAAVGITPFDESMVFKLGLANQVWQMDY